MNRPIRYQFALLTACAVLPATGLFAQAPAPDATPSVSTPAAPASPDATPAEGKHHGHHGRHANLTPEERQKLKAAHDKALQDPAVKSAEANRETDRKGYRKAVHDAMLRADPSIQPILNKTRAGRRAKKDA